MKHYKTNIKAFLLVANNTDFKKVKITSSKDVAEYARNFYHEDIGVYESVFMIFLNRANNTIGYAKISQGGISVSVIDVRIIAKYALDSLASSVILVHNHPSGSLIASKADKDITLKVGQTLNLCDIQLLDHVIIVPESKSYVSFADEGYHLK